LTTLKRTSIIILTIVCLTWTTPVIAQDPTPTASPTETAIPLQGVATPQPAATRAIYIIQPGDFLSTIAIDFNVSLPDLLAVNNITDPNSISAGTEITIPGLDGVNGIIEKKPLAYGDTLLKFSRRNQISEDLLVKLNHITSLSQIYPGIPLIYPQNDTTSPLTKRTSLDSGETLLEASVLADIDPSNLISLNNLPGSWAALPGDILYSASESKTETGPNGMPSAFEDVSVSPVVMKQGGTVVITIKSAAGVTLGGTLVDKPLHFFPTEDGKQVALQGIYAFLSPGSYPLILEATLPDGTKQSFQQMVFVQTGYYPSESLVVPPSMIDPTVTVPELTELTALVAPASSQKYWSDIFKSPASLFPDGMCFSSRFGNIRSYNGGPFDSFHTGLDFCGGTGLQITAPADGVVIFAGPLTVRGNATIIDHGWGIYSGIWHQSEIKVKVGQTVKAGDAIGIVGGTGRVTGPHLHWEVWVNGIQVDPMDWLENKYP